MGQPIFGANSLLDSDTVTSSESLKTGFPLARLSDDRIFTLTIPTSGGSITTWDIITDAGVGNTSDTDYFMMVGHNLFSQSVDSIVFASSPDNVVYTPIFTEASIVDDDIVLRTFTKVTARFFRLRISKAAGGLEDVVAIGQLQWGTRVQLDAFIQRGFDPQNERIRGRFNRSQTGNIIGALSTFQERRGAISLPLVLDSELRDTTSPGGFLDFWDNHASLLRPFVFAWNPGSPGSFEKDAMFCVVDAARGIARPTVVPVAGGRRDLTFQVIGLKE